MVEILLQVDKNLNIPVRIKFFLEYPYVCLPTSQIITQAKFALQIQSKNIQFMFTKHNAINHCAVQCQIN